MSSTLSFIAQSAGCSAWGARLRSANRGAHRVPTCVTPISMTAGTIATMSAPPARSTITRSLVLILNQSRKCIALAPITSQDHTPSRGLTLIEKFLLVYSAMNCDDAGERLAEQLPL